MARTKIYTEEYVRSLAKQCQTMQELRRKFPSAYRACHTLKLHYRDLGFSFSTPTPRYKYTKEQVFLESEKYHGQGRKAFERGSNWAYAVAKRRKWLDEMPWLGRLNPYKDKVYFAYAYEFCGHNAVYVGITNDLIRRDAQHRRLLGHKERSSVFKFSEVNRCAIPPHKVLASELSIEEAQIAENWFIEKYKKCGWNVLNKAATGLHVGSIGACSKRWNKNSIIEIALGCESRTEFWDKGRGAAEAARKLGIYHEICDKLWPKKTKEIPIKVRRVITDAEIIEEQKKYSTRNDFISGNHRYYNLAKKRGLLSIPSKCAERKIRSIRELDGSERMFDNAYAASRELSVKRVNIIQCCRGKKRHIKGYRFYYAV